MLEGLRRLIAHNYHLTVSQRAQENLSNAVRESNNIVDFLASQGHVMFKADCEASTKDLYIAYRNWCEDNAENVLSQKRFASFLSQNADEYNLEATNNVYTRRGCRCRGYMGICVILSLAEI